MARWDADGDFPYDIWSDYYWDSCCWCGWFLVGVCVVVIWRGDLTTTDDKGIALVVTGA